MGEDIQNGPGVRTARRRTGVAAIAVLAALLLFGFSGAAIPGARGAPAPASFESSVPAGPPAWQSAPVVPQLKGRLLARLRYDAKRGKKLGMRSDVFAKVGDSNTEMAGAFYGLACAKPDPPLGPKLAAVVRRYNRVRLPNPDPLPGCGPSTSFSRHSVATRTGAPSFWPGWPIAKLSDESYWKSRPVARSMRPRSAASSG